MKRTIKPFAVEVRRSRKSPSGWPAEPQPASPPQWLGTTNAFTVADHQHGGGAQDTAKPITGRILPALLPERPAGDQQPMKAQTKKQPTERVLRQKVAEPINTAQRAEKQTATTATMRLAVGLLETEHTPDSALNANLRPAATKPTRIAFRREERWKARLPAVVARKHLKRYEGKGNVPVIAAE